MNTPIYILRKTITYRGEISYDAFHLLVLHRTKITFNLVRLYMRLKERGPEFFFNICFVSIVGRI